MRRPRWIPEWWSLAVIMLAFVACPVFTIIYFGFGCDR